jgi:uncharacterized protein
MDIRNKSFLITGSSSGIGAATARYAASKGAKVILVARSEDKLKRICQEIRDSGGTANYYPADLSDLVAIREVASLMKEKEGTPDIIMNNAGSGQWKRAKETTPEEASAMMNVPYMSAFAMTHAFLPQLIERKSGMIINMTSAAAYMTWPGATSYIAARWAVRGFNDALRAELKAQGVGVMLVAFARVTSDYWVHNPGSEQNIPKRQSIIPELSPEAAAKHIVSGIEHDRQQVIEPWQLRFILVLSKFFPGMVK